MNSFVALDVETANTDYSSICAIGAARFEGGLVTDEWYRLVDPGVDFFWKNVEIHGIRAGDVDGRPRFVDLASEMQEFVDGGVIVHHGHFDRNAIAQACERWQLPPPVWRFVDTLTAAKQAWPTRRNAGYKLPDLCRDIGHELVHHHNALDDARGAGAVFLALRERLNDDQIDALAQEITPPEERRYLWSADVDLSLMRDVIVFSKDAAATRDDPHLLFTLMRRGAKVRSKLGNDTTIYVLSNREWRNKVVTAQRRRASERLARGQRLQIMSETDFLAMIENS